MLELIDYLFPQILNLISGEHFGIILVMFMITGSFKLVKKVLNL